MLFTPFELKSVTFPNRIVMPPMCHYSAGEDGLANEWHFVHYGARAVGCVGCFVVEATAVEPRGRISRRDLGLWDDSQIGPLQKMVDFCRSHGTVMGIQIAHAGRKACGPISRSFSAACGARATSASCLISSGNCGDC